MRSVDGRKRNDITGVVFLFSAQGASKTRLENAIKCTLIPDVQKWRVRVALPTGCQSLLAPSFVAAAASVVSVIILWAKGLVSLCHWRLVAALQTRAQCVCTNG